MRSARPALCRNQIRTAPPQQISLTPFYIKWGSLKVEICRTGRRHGSPGSFGEHSSCWARHALPTLLLPLQALPKDTIQKPSSRNLTYFWRFPEKNSSLLWHTDLFQIHNITAYSRAMWYILSKTFSWFPVVNVATIPPPLSPLPTVYLRVHTQSRNRWHYLHYSFSVTIMNISLKSFVSFNCFSMSRSFPKGNKRWRDIHQTTRYLWDFHVLYELDVKRTYVR